MPTHTLTRKRETKGKDLIDQIDVLHLRGALVAINSLLSKLPSPEKLNRAGRRFFDEASDMRTAMRVMLARHDAGELTFEALTSGRGGAA